MHDLKLRLASKRATPLLGDGETSTEEDTLEFRLDGTKINGENNT